MISLFLKQINFLTKNIHDYKILINNIPYHFDEILSRYIKIIKPSILINMLTVYKNPNFEFNLLSKKLKTFHISNQRLIIDDQNLKKNARQN